MPHTYAQYYELLIDATSTTFGFARHCSYANSTTCIHKKAYQHCSKGAALTVLWKHLRGKQDLRIGGCKYEEWKSHYSFLLFLNILQVQRTFKVKKRPEKTNTRTEFRWWAIHKCKYKPGSSCLATFNIYAVLQSFVQLSRRSRKIGKFPHNLSVDTRNTLFSLRIATYDISSILASV